MRQRTGAGRSRVAVIGSGVSGLTAAYLLQRSYDVTLYEADDRLGGHAHTHDVTVGRGATVAVDSGFIVHNERTYPNLIKLFGELGVETQPTEMSLSVRCDGCGLEYAGARGVRGLFAQRRAIRDPRLLRLLAEIVLFHRHARRTLRSSGEAAPETLADFLTRHRHSRYFIEHFARPLVSSVWSTGAGDALRYPAAYLFRFLDNHGMLSVSGSPRWRTVTGGSRRYVERAVKELTATRTATPVRGLERHAESTTVRTTSDETADFDHVVVATHADQALRLLADPTPLERRVLGAFGFTRNEAVLHTDTSVLPRSPHASASWNYFTPRCGGDPTAGGVAITYDMNRLHRFATGDTRLLVSLGQSVESDQIVQRMTYEHPAYTPESVAAQRELPRLMDGRTQYAGAWQGWGFHEDGCASGVRSAARLGVVW